MHPTWENTKLHIDCQILKPEITLIEAVHGGDVSVAILQVKLHCVPKMSPTCNKLAITLPKVIRFSAFINLAATAISDVCWEPESCYKPCRRPTEFSRPIGLRLGLVLQTDVHQSSLHLFLIIIIMHFISGSMAHKNTASEKTETD